jgi:hypothetical protein
MKEHTNFLTVEQIAQFRDIFDEYVGHRRLAVKYWIDHEETIREVFNKDVKRLIQQERTDVKDSMVGQKVRAVLSPIVLIPATTNIWLVRSHNPIGIHVDADEIKNQHGRTFIIPLTFDHRIKTVVWDKVITMSKFNSLAQAFAADSTAYTKVNNISNELLLNNCWAGNPSITDYIDVEGIATWDMGTVIEFDREKLHASNNYTAFVPHKDYILIHADE